MDNWFIGLIIVIYILIIALIKMGIKIVPQDEKWIVERLGKFSKILTPGLNTIFPVFDHIVQKLDMREQVIHLPSQEIMIQDNDIVEIDGVVFYQIVDAVKATYQVSDLTHAILNATATHIHIIIGSMDLNELLFERDHINQQLLSAIDKDADSWGVKMLDIEIRGIYYFKI